ncbi:polysaccharide biosynthesis/export family protein [uncultured Flavobacterium sp.]|uniref:polysaccharide biosynthesis/export family protein n=1 Tax=uncultured Flavobacterium sp. TaxID=165435 RepID=UPI0025E32058|nr:polysaccharide biosynthesis/export family protein [uncultured Flavobacterium sp.]
MMIKRGIFFLIAVFVFASCASRKEMLYLTNNPVESSSTVKFETTLQPDDNLIITVTSNEPKLANDFNMLYLTAQGTQVMQVGSNTILYSYLIDQNGEIDFPVLGKLKLSGLTRVEAEQKLRDLLVKQISDVGVNLRVLNFKVTVEGEVNNPGPVSVVGDRITIFEAIGYAGDLTIYGKRQNVKLIREKDGVKTIVTLDLTDGSIINSPYYYLAHNDLIYVEPNKTRINSSVIGPNLTVGISALSLIVTIIALSTR